MTRTLFQNRARPWPQPLAIAFLSSLFLLSAPKSVPSPPGVPPVGLLLDPVDASRSRTVPLKIHLPPGQGPKPLVLFSHGLGGSRESSSYPENRWASAGYVPILLQHPGSDRAIWEGTNPRERFAALQSATNLQATKHRFEDVPFVIDQLEPWNTEPSAPLAGRLNLEDGGAARAGLRSDAPRTACSLDAGGAWKWK